MPQSTIPTINVWFAKECNKALIITKYPKGTYQMTMWDLNTDKFTGGQWVKHKRIKMDRCGLSPDANHFGYFMFDFTHTCGPTFTVISKPPYFSGLYCQGEEGTWTGGAYFQNNNTIVMKPYMVKINNLPKEFSIVDPSPLGSNCGGGRRDERVLSFHTTTCKDPLGRTINTDKGKLFINGIETIDFTGNTFVSVKPPY